MVKGEADGIAAYMVVPHNEPIRMLAAFLTPERHLHIHKQVALVNLSAVFGMAIVALVV